jgi:hypothetical protein
VEDEDLVVLAPVLTDWADDARLDLAVGLDGGPELGDFGLGESGTGVLGMGEEDGRRQRLDGRHGGSPWLVVVL